MRRQLFAFLVCALINPFVHAADRVDRQPAAPSIESLIGKAPCQHDTDCRTVAVGWNACGGPQRYLAWSLRATSEQALQAAIAARQSQASATLPGRDASVCIVLQDPGAFCRRPGDSPDTGRCELRSGTARAATLPALGTR